MMAESVPSEIDAIEAGALASALHGGDLEPLMSAMGH